MPGTKRGGRKPLPDAQKKKRRVLYLTDTQFETLQRAIDRLTEETTTMSTATTVHITEEHLGPDATEADARKMVELLKARGYDAHYGTGRNRLSDEEVEQYDADFAACLEQLN